MQEVNFTEGTVMFKKVLNVPFKKTPRRRSLEINKPFTPVPVHPIRSKIPSKTKVAKLYARIKNLERQRADARRQIRGFKGRPRH